VIAFLRFIGLMNASIWLGTAIFFSLGAGPACVSESIQALLGAKNFPFYSVAIQQVLMSRYFAFLSISALIALLHLLFEWIYMGRPARQFSVMLLGGLIAMILLGGLIVKPRIDKLHAMRYAPNVAPAQRASAATWLHVWRGGFHLINIIMIGGLVVYVWRTANPTDTPRFISSVKFRG
jgi:hypothetical protein